MAEVQNRNPNETPDATTKKRKGFFANLFGRSGEKKDDEKKGGIMNTIGQAAAKGVAKVAEHEATKQVEKQLDNNNGSQPADPSSAMPDASNMTPSDAVEASTNWAKKMVGSAQQKMQNLQGSLGV